MNAKTRLFRTADLYDTHVALAMHAREPRLAGPRLSSVAAGLRQHRARADRRRTRGLCIRIWRAHLDHPIAKTGHRRVRSRRERDHVHNSALFSDNPICHRRERERERTRTPGHTVRYRYRAYTVPPTHQTASLTALNSHRRRGVWGIRYALSRPLSLPC